jgi:hypothetical protein
MHEVTLVDEFQSAWCAERPFGRDTKGVYHQHYVSFQSAWCAERPFGPDEVDER